MSSLFGHAHSHWTLKKNKKVPSAANIKSLTSFFKKHPIDKLVIADFPLADFPLEGLEPVPPSKVGFRIFLCPPPAQLSNVVPQIMAQIKNRPGVKTTNVIMTSACLHARQ